MLHTVTLRTLIVIALLVAAAGCDDPVQVGPQGLGPVAPVPAPADDVAVAEGADAGTPSETDRMLNYRDEQFVESEANRDPFRSFERLFEARPIDAPQIDAIMGHVSIDDMRLIAVISGVASPRAMILDPAGVGHVVQRGDFLGRPEVVQTGGAESVAVPLHWRVERIRAGRQTPDRQERPAEVVLSREDRTAPNRPPLTRVLSLFEERPQ
jgi:type IV pilus assembly protein PilP